MERIPRCTATLGQVMRHYIKNWLHYTASKHRFHALLTQQAPVIPPFAFRLTNRCRRLESECFVCLMVRFSTSG